ncbi:MAG TPA: amidase [Bacilli bacterium]|nr:amidase [Bacilli bacterium]
MKKIIKLSILFIFSFLVFITNSFGLTKAPIDITTATISELEYYIEQGYITSEQLVNLYLERIEEYNDQYNAIRFINEDVIKEARELDEKLASGEKVGVLHGIPIVVKTNIDVEGIPTTAGAKALADNYPNTDAEVIQKLKDAGAIILATTNMSEFAFSAGNSNSSYGKVYNAYDTDYSPYGSSGGSAVSVAASFATAALGTDTNSSVRVPASAANLVGIRPTVGLISSDGVIPYDITRDTVGVLSKTVSDNALLLSVIDDIDEEYITTDTSLEGVTIGVINSFLEGSSTSTLKANSLTNEEIYNMMLNAIKEMESAGATIVYIDDFFTSYYYYLWSSSLAGFTFCDGFNSYVENTTGSIRSFESLATASGRIYSLSGYASSCGKTTSTRLASLASTREKYQDHVDEVFSEYNLDAIVYPTTKNKIYKLSVQESGVRAPSTFVSSATGYPSITVPLGFDSDDLPYGIEFLALENEENTLYKIASAYESLGSGIVTPSIAPSLYEVPTEVTELITYNENTTLWEDHKISLITEVNELENKIETYFLDYSDNENVASDATDLLNEIKLLETENGNKEEEYNKIAYILIGSSFVIFLLLGSLKKKKRRRR